MGFWAKTNFTGMFSDSCGRRGPDTQFIHGFHDTIVEYLKTIDKEP